MIDFMGDADADSVTLADAEDFQGYLVADKPNGKGLAQWSANSMCKSAGSIFAWAWRHEMVGRNPFDGLKKFKVSKVVRIYKSPELTALLDAADEIWRIRILAAVDCGLRRGEIANTTWSDIDFVRQVICVQSKKDDRDLGTWKWAAKNRKNRMVPMSEKLTACLLVRQSGLLIRQEYPFLTERRYLNLRRRIGSLPERVRICPDENWTRPFNIIRQNAGVRKGTFHDLRRTCLTRWSYAMAPQELQALAGHSNFKTTLEYYSAIGSDYLERARDAEAVV
jgi:integrase